MPPHPDESRNVKKGENVKESKRKNKAEVEGKRVE
jgi:hypothetical protein